MKPPTTFQEAAATLKYGTVSAVDPSKCRVRVQFADYDGLESAWLPVMQSKTLKDQHYSLPDVGEHVVTLLDQRGEDGVILGSIYSDADLPPVTSGDKHHIKFEDGSTVEYDRSSGTLAVDAKGPIQITAAQPITLTAPQVTADGLLTYTQGLTGAGGETTATITGTVHIIGQLIVEGNVDVDGDIDATGDIIDGGSNTNHHSH